MGKLLERYTAPSDKVTLVLPVSKDKFSFNRPTRTEVDEIQKYAASHKDDKDGSPKVNAKIFKLLCDEFTDESEKNLVEDINKFAVPDQSAVFTFFMELCGIDKEELVNLLRMTKI